MGRCTNSRHLSINFLKNDMHKKVMLMTVSYIPYIYLLYPIHTHYIPSKRCSYSGHRSINFVNNNMHKKVILRTVSYIQGWVMTFPRFAECEARLASASLFPGVEDTCRPARVSNSWAESAPSHTPIFSSRSQH
jgi:hypothetical protein